MKALVTGAGGQLGQGLMRTRPPACRMIAVTRQELDITDTPSVLTLLQREGVDVVINAAAYTNVEAAEHAPEAAYAVNSNAVAALAAACAEHGARMVHVSTDFVFDGTKKAPYTVGDAPAPINVYGASKLAGERSAIEILGRNACVVRASWLHGAPGNNFVTRMLGLMSTRGAVRVVADEIGTPTSVHSLAPVLWLCAGTNASGIHHWSDAGCISRFEFAQAIAVQARACGLLDADPRIERARPGEFSGTVRRPAFTPLDTAHTQSALGIRPIAWMEGLQKTLGDLRNLHAVTQP